MYKWNGDWEELKKYYVSFPPEIRDDIIVPVMRSRKPFRNAPWEYFLQFLRILKDEVEEDGL